MKAEEIAIILYEMSLDMDYADYSDQAENEINNLVVEIEALKDGNFNYLLSALEIIAEQNRQ